MNNKPMTVSELKLLDFFTRDLTVADYINTPIQNLIDHPEYDEETFLAIAAMVNAPASQYKKYIMKGTK